MGALSGVNFQQLLSQYAPGSATYQELLGVMNNPQALNNPAIAQSVAGSLQYAPMPDVTGTLPNGQQGTIPYNATPPPNVSNLQLNAPGAPQYSLPPGSAGAAATPNLTPVPQPMTGASLNPDQMGGGSGMTGVGGAGGPMGAGAVGGNPDQPWSGMPSLNGSPIIYDPMNPGVAADQPGGGSGLYGNPLNPLATLYGGRNGTTGIGAQSNSPQSNTNSPQTSLSSILAGLGGNFNLGNVLPAALGIGAGLWQYLGSDAAFNQAGNLINNAEQGAGTQVNNAAQGAASGVNGAAGQGNNFLSQLLSYYNGQTAPYQNAGATAAGQLNSGLQPGGALNSNLTADQVMQNDPGYQFRLGQGLQGVQSKLAAEGLGDSGAAAKELEQYGQDYASSQYQQAFQNQQTQQQNLFGRLYGTSGLGLTGTGQGITSGEAFGAPQASNLLSAANSAGGFNLAGSQYQGNANVTGAGAQAGAIIDANQQKNAMIQQIFTSLMSLFQNQQGNQTPSTVINGSDYPLPPGTTSGGVPVNNTRYQPA